MKHTLKITLLLVLLFLSSQMVGLLIIKQYTNEDKTYKDLPFGVERPEMSGTQLLIYIAIAILIGTALMLILIRFRQKNFIKVWMFLAVFLCLTFTLSVIIDQNTAVILSFLAAGWKIFKPNPYIHNITEVFMYSGIAAIFVPMLNLWTVILLLIIISIYDMIAVWGLKHMITLATYQAESNAFAGLLIPYKKTEQEKKKVARKESKKSSLLPSAKPSTAVLGGGDIAFPLLFAGTLLKTYTLTDAFIISFTASAALFLLLYYSQKGKFYPAMPFLTAGCFIGLGMVYLI